MVEAIADTSALQYLHQLGLLQVLPSLGSAVHVPSAVAAEIQEGIRLGKNMPDLASCVWLKRTDPSKSPTLPRQDDLGAGEAAVLRLAIERPGSVAILDDKAARQVAKELRLPYVGVLGILLQMKKRGLVTKVKPLLDHLEGLGFRLAKTTRAEALEMAGE